MCEIFCVTMKDYFSQLTPSTMRHIILVPFPYLFFLFFCKSK